jgi:integrase
LGADFSHPVAAGQGEETSIRGFQREWKAWIETHRRKGRWLRHDLARVRLFIRKLPEDRRTVESVTTREIMDFFRWGTTKRKWSAVTVLRYREQIRAFFGHAVRLGLIVVNPTAAVPRPRVPDRIIRYLTHDEIDTCMAAVKGDVLEPMVAVCIFAGLRRLEAVYLRWEDMELSGARPALTIRRKEGWTPKTGRPRRVPISSRLLTSMLRLPKRSDWLLPSPRGLRWCEDNATHRLQVLMEKAKLKWTFADFRRTFASHLAMNGVSAFKIARLMGTSVAMIERHYAHLMPEDLHREVEF